MKNLMARLDLLTTDDLAAARTAIARTRTRGDHESADAGEAVLLDPIPRQHYRRMHLQYEAMHAARACLQHVDAEDTHRWKERLEEFNVPDEPSLRD